MSEPKAGRAADEAARTYADLLSQLEAQRRTADLALLSTMAPVRHGAPRGQAGPRR